MQKFSDLSKDLHVEIIYNVYAAYHGFSLCDSHSGILKQSKHRAELMGEIPSNAFEFKDFVKDH